MEELPVETTVYSLSQAAPALPERRQDERHLTLFRVGTLLVDGQRELCLIKNVSAGGMLVRAYTDLRSGRPVSIELKQGDPISGRVSWVQDGYTGIAFDAPVDVVALLTASMDGPRPRMPRVEVRCIASIRQDGHVYGMRTSDISQGGIKVESDRNLAVGGDVVVTLPGLAPVAGVIRWRDSGSYGITFNRLLALSELVSWLQGQRELVRAAG